MAGFDRLKMQSTKWHSHPSYTGMGGYKMCLGVDANGNGAGEGTHVSVYTYFMRGQFDSCLEWPFCGSVTIQLVNQLEDKEHHTRNIRYTVSTSASRVTIGERSGGRGTQTFLLHSALGLSVANNCQYLKDNCLVFRIVSIND